MRNRMECGFYTSADRRIGRAVAGLSEPPSPQGGATEGEKLTLAPSVAAAKYMSIVRLTAAREARARGALNVDGDGGRSPQRQ